MKYNLVYFIYIFAKKISENRNKKGVKKYMLSYKK